MALTAPRFVTQVFGNRLARSKTLRCGGFVEEEDAGLVGAEGPKGGDARFHGNRGDLVVGDDSVAVCGAADESEVISAGFTG